MATVEEKVLVLLLKDYSGIHTASSISLKLKMSRWGVWKVLKRLEKEEIIVLRSVGKGRTSTKLVSLNFENKVTIKSLELFLVQEAMRQKRWVFNFEELEAEVEFMLLFGSVLHSPKTAGDIDILTVSKKRKLKDVNKVILKLQRSQEKMIHSFNYTEKEFRIELLDHNKSFMDGIKKGVILFGQENFVSFMRGILSDGRKTK